MAEDDFDPMPIGSTYQMGGLSSDDPLVDWASNLKREDLQQFLHDPEGFKNNMVNQGIPPPDHHYVATDQGLQPVQPGLVGDPSQGNLTRYDSAAPPRSRALGYSDPGGGFGESPEAEAQQGKPGVPSGLGKAFLPPPLSPQRVPIAPASPPIPGATYSPSGAPTGRTQGPAPGQPPYTPPQEGLESAAAPAEKSNLEKLREQVEEKKLKAQLKDDKTEALSSEALSDFAKSMQGVKMPTRPQLAAPGTIAPRSPVSLQPGVANLLQAIGHQQPQITPLMRLLGRA